jgi:hypothetical protein
MCSEIKPPAVAEIQLGCLLLQEKSSAWNIKGGKLLWLKTAHADENVFSLAQ